MFCFCGFIQVHFLWFHIKDVIKSFETFERYLKYMMLQFNRSLAVVNCCQFGNLFIWVIWDKEEK